VANTGYSLLVIDDQFNDRREDYKRMLEPEFDLDFITNEHNIETDIKHAYDGYILDLVLRPDWCISSEIILKEYMARINVPVFLLSGRWKTDVVIGFLREMAIGKPQVVGLLDWNDFISDKPYSRPDVVSSIKVSLDKWYRREGQPPGNREEITILHVSDTQIGDPNYSFVSQGIEEHIAETLGSTSKGADLVILSGDVAYSGSPQEYLKAKDWCKKLIKDSLVDGFDGCYEDRLLLVPGNHDVDLCVLGSDSVEYDFGALNKDEYPVKVVDKRDLDQRRDNGELNTETYPRAEMGLNSFGNFARLVSTHSRIESLEGTYVEKFLNWDIDLVLVSTVGLTSILDTQVVGTRQSVLDRISSQARRMNGKEKPYRILVTHHPPPEILHADPNETARWNPEAWDAFRGWIGRLEPDLWLAGHTHMGEATTLGPRLMKSGLPCLVAPTLTLKQQVRAEDALRGFAILKLIRTGDRVSEAKVEWYDLKGSEKPKLDKSRTRIFKRST